MANKASSSQPPQTLSSLVSQTVAPTQSTQTRETGPSEIPVSDALPPNIGSANPEVVPTALPARVPSPPTTEGAESSSESPQFSKEMNPVNAADLPTARQTYGTTHDHSTH